MRNSVRFTIIIVFFFFIHCFSFFFFLSLAYEVGVCRRTQVAAAKKLKRNVGKSYNGEEKKSVLSSFSRLCLFLLASFHERNSELSRNKEGRRGKKLRSARESSPLLPFFFFSFFFFFFFPPFFSIIYDVSAINYDVVLLFSLLLLVSWCKSACTFFLCVCVCCSESFSTRTIDNCY